MKTIKVTYTVRPEFVEKNKENIKKVMGAVTKLNHPGIKYSSHMKEDDLTFVHIGHFDSHEALQSLNGLPEFKQFQSELKTSFPISKPNAEVLNVVGSNWEIFEELHAG